MATPFLLDCDTGIDDALALLYLLTDPGVDLVGVTNVFGNVTAAQASANTLGLLTLAGRADVPVATGAGHPLKSDYAPGAGHVHGSDGVGGVNLPEPAVGVSGEHAVDMIIRLAREHEGRLHLVATAPLTNLALALQKEPNLPEMIADITIMGGAALVPGNISPLAEANIGNDPEAAAVVLAAPWHITLVPLDVTMTQVLEEDDRLELISAPGPAAAAAGQMLDFYFGFYEQVFGRRCSAMHDPLAAAIATGGMVPELAPVVNVEVDTTDGPGRGQTVCEMRGIYRGYPPQQGAHCRVVLRMGERFAPHLISRIRNI